MTRTTRLFVTFLSIATLMFGASLAHSTTDITLTASSTAVSTSSKWWIGESYLDPLAAYR